MATQTAQGPLPTTTRALPQQETKSPQIKERAKWHHFTRLWSEAITEFQGEMKSTEWGHTTAITFYLSLCCTWAGVLVAMCLFVPFMSLGYRSDSGHCAPDGSFRLEPFSLLEPTWFFQVVLGFGSLDFTTAKAIDIFWDVVVGRAGQTLLAYISWKAFSRCLYSVMTTGPITYKIFWTVFMQDGPSLRSIIRTLRDFTWFRGLRPKPIMFVMILTMTFVLAFPTLASAMTGYSANNQAWVQTDDVRQVLFSQFERARYVIYDGNRVGLTVPYVIVSEDDEQMACGFSGCVQNYIDDYDVSKPETSNWNGTDLGSPTLNISSLWDHRSKMPYVFENKAYDNEYFQTNDRAVCQPVMEDNQQKYQWGFSVLQLEITVCLTTLWTFGIYIMWATAHLHLASMGLENNAQGNFKSTISLADAIRKECKEQLDKDVNSLTERELMSYIKTHLNGGRMMVQSPPLVPRQSVWRFIWKWVMANKAWTVAFAIVSWFTWIYATFSLIWLTMTFSMVAGWGKKTRNLVLLLSLLSAGLLPAGYLTVRFLRKYFNGVFGNSTKGPS